MANAGLILKIEGFKNFNAALKELDKVAAKLDTRFVKVVDSLNRMSTIESAQTAKNIDSLAKSLDNLFTSIGTNHTRIAKLSAEIDNLSLGRGSVDRLNQRLNELGAPRGGFFTNIGRDFAAIAGIAPTLDGIAKSVEGLNKFRPLFGLKFRSLSRQLASAVPDLARFANAFKDSRQVFRNVLDLSQALENFSRLKTGNVLERLLGRGLENKLKAIGKALNKAAKDFAVFAQALALNNARLSLNSLSELINGLSRLQDIKINSFLGLFGGIEPKLRRLARVLREIAPDFLLFSRVVGSDIGEGTRKLVNHLESLSAVDPDKLRESLRLDAKALHKAILDDFQLIEDAFSSGSLGVDNAFTRFVQGVRGKADRTVKEIRAVLSFLIGPDATGALISSISSFLSGLIRPIQEFVDRVKTRIDSIITAIKAPFRRIREVIVHELSSFVQDIRSSGIIRAIPELLLSVFAFVAGDRRAVEVAVQLRKFFIGVRTTLVNEFGRLEFAIPGLIKRVDTALSNLFSRSVSFKGVSERIVQAFSGIPADLEAKFTAITFTFSRFLKRFFQEFNRQARRVGPTVALFNAIFSFGSAATNLIIRSASRAAQLFQSRLVTEFRRFNNVGVNILRGLLGGLSGIAKEAARISRRFIDSFKKVLGIQSPSTVMRGIGLNVVQGFQAGLSGIARLGANAARGFVDSFKDTFRRLGPELLRSSQQALNQGFRNLAQGGIAGLLQSRAFAAPLSAAIDFESAFAGIIKTVDVDDLGAEAGREFLAGLNTELRRLATGDTPLAGIENAQVELARIGEVAGQLGIARDNILEFTEVIGQLGLATDIVGDEGAKQLAQFANITQSTEFERLGATIVDLGNNSATTESQILEFGQRLAGAGHLAGLTEANILAVGATMASLGLRAEAGSTAFNKLVRSMIRATATAGDSSIVTGAQQIAAVENKIAEAQEKRRVAALKLEAAQDRLNRANNTSSRINAQLAVEKHAAEVAKLDTFITRASGSIQDLDEDAEFLSTTVAGKLEDFARVAGMSATAFGDAFANDPARAMESFIRGLSQLTAEDRIKALDELGLSEVRLTDTLLRLSNAPDLLSDSLNRADIAWEENTALVDEANKRFETAQAQLNRLKNIFRDVGISIGNLFLPNVVGAAQVFGDFLQGVNTFIQNNPAIVKSVLSFVAAIGLLGAGLITLVGAFQVIGGLIGLVLGAQVTAVTLVVRALSFALLNPLGVVVGISTLGAAFIGLLAPLAIAGAAFAAFQLVTSEISNNVAGAGDAFDQFRGKVGVLFANLKDVFDELVLIVTTLFGLIRPAERTFSPLTGALQRVNKFLDSLNQNILKVRRGLRNLSSLFGLGTSFLNAATGQDQRATLLERENELLSEQERLEQRIADLQAGRVEGAESYKEVLIEAGDTLSGIAAREGVSIEDLIRINEIEDPNFILAGATLRIPVEGAVNVEEELARAERLKRDIENRLAATRFDLDQTPIEEVELSFQTIKSLITDISGTTAFKNLFGTVTPEQIEGMAGKILVMKGRFDNLKESIGNVRDAFFLLFDGSVEGRFETFKNSIKVLAQDTKAAIRSLLNFVDDPFNEVSPEAAELSASGIVTVQNTGTNPATKLFRSIFDSFQNLNFSGLRPVFDTHFDAIKGIAVAAAVAFVPGAGLFVAAVKALELAIRNDFLGISTFLDESGIRRTAEGLFSRVVSLFTSVAQEFSLLPAAQTGSKNLDAQASSITVPEQFSIEPFIQLAGQLVGSLGQAIFSFISSPEFSTALGGFGALLSSIVTAFVSGLAGEEITTEEILPNLFKIAGKIIGSIGSAVVNFITSPSFGESVGGFSNFLGMLIDNFFEGVNEALSNAGEGTEDDKGVGERVSALLAGVIVTGMGIHLAGLLITKGFVGAVGGAISIAMSGAGLLAKLGVGAFSTAGKVIADGLGAGLATHFVTKVGPIISAAIAGLQTIGTAAVGALASGASALAGGGVAAISSFIATAGPVIAAAAPYFLIAAAAIAAILAIRQLQIANAGISGAAEFAGTELSAEIQAGNITQDDVADEVFRQMSDQFGDGLARILFAVYNVEGESQRVIDAGMAATTDFAEGMSNEESLTTAREAGDDVATAAAEGIEEGLDEYEWTSPSAAADQIISNFHEKWGIKSPSTVFKKMAGLLGDGLLEGLTEKGPELLAGVTTLVNDNIAAPIKNLLASGTTEGGEGTNDGGIAWLIQLGGGIPTSLAIGIRNNLPTLSTATGELVQVFSTMQSDIAKQLNKAIGKINAFTSTVGKALSAIENLSTQTGGDLSLVGIGPGRQHGGAVFPGFLHPVIEDGNPELFTNRNGQTFLISPQGGFVTPFRSFTGGVGSSSSIDNRSFDNSVVVQVSVNGGNISQAELDAIERAAERGVQTANRVSLRRRASRVGAF